MLRAPREQAPAKPIEKSIARLSARSASALFRDRLRLQHLEDGIEEHPDARDPVYRNRRRIRGNRGRRLLRLRGERLERPFAHLYETGRMQRVDLRGHENILKRVLLQAGACNLGLLMRHLVGVGTPRGLQGRGLGLLGYLWGLLVALTHLSDAIWTRDRPFRVA